MLCPRDIKRYELDVRTGEANEGSRQRHLSRRLTRRVRSLSQPIRIRRRSDGRIESQVATRRRTPQEEGAPGQSFRWPKVKGTFDPHHARRLAPAKVPRGLPREYPATRSATRRLTVSDGRCGTRTEARSLVSAGKLKVLVRPARLERATSWFVARRNEATRGSWRQLPLVFPSRSRSSDHLRPLEASAVCQSFVSRAQQMIPKRRGERHRAISMRAHSADPKAV